MFYRTTLFNSDEQGNTWKVREYPIGTTTAVHDVLTCLYDGTKIQLGSYRVTLEMSADQSAWTVIDDSN